MKLGVLTQQDKDRIRATLGEALQERDEALAACLFGSAASSEPVVNDVDVLVLLREPDSPRALLQLLELEVFLAERLGISSDLLDLIPFDLRCVEPAVLHDALETGVLLKCADEEALTDAIEALSHYFLENESVLRRQVSLRREMFA